MYKERINVTKAVLPPLEDYIEEIKDIWSTSWLTNMGQKHNELERKLIEYLDVENISLFTNGHLSLELLLQGMKLKGEVITTPFTFASTTHAIVRNNLIPVFCDINEEDYTIDTTKLESLITDKTCAILAVHVYGNVCNVKEIERIAKKHDLKVIYDAAHAFGVEVKGKGIGNFGDASMFSFHATKVFNTIEGGAVVYKDDEIGRSLYTLKNFGIKSETIIDGVGSNAKMNEFQASMGLCNLKYINSEIEKRKKIVELYRSRLQSVDGIKIIKENKNIKYNYSYFPIVVDEKIFGYTRNEICENLKKHNVFARKYFYPLVNDFECYRDIFDVNDTPIALRISKRVLTLPLYGDITAAEVNMICDIILGENDYE